ncbi:MAG: hypothetical protein HeimC3_15260 [Candidatus Heimdallarchaeota archaeon LC_3]|nr:MAG: hypothetical protein HeimC3_15260 [Candidatus Heimdallarchaeota archaeon LC_3]
MARGGGGFGGGGFGGGGFGGGGFRGGSSSFRSGSMRSSGRPFGRTGAHRSVSRSPRGRNYNRSHHGYYGGWYRPWYHQYYWFWGYPYRPWYYSPVYMGGGFFLFIIALLIIIPLFGLLVVPYPGNDASSSGVVIYRDTQTLNYNEYWFESENIPSGSTIEYEMQSQSPVTFLIWDQPFENFPTTSGTRTGNYQKIFTVLGDHDYEYLGYFLRPGDRLEIDFEISLQNEVEFFIADADALNRWNNWETITPEKSETGIGNYSVSFTAPYAQDWYLVWYNFGSSSAQVDMSVSYTVAAIDYTQADVVKENTDFVPKDSFTALNSGNWYFFIYFDPFVNPAESVDITFVVSFDTQVTSNDRWVDTSPLLMFIGLIIIIILAVAIYQRRSAKKNKPVTTVGSIDATQTKITESKQLGLSSASKCHRCSYKYNANETYCKNCGAKLMGRDYGLSLKTTPFGSTNCINCKEKLHLDDIFCSNCGVKVEQN